MTEPRRLGVLCVVSGPSGSGKTTLCRRLAQEDPARCRYSISCTTRPPREGEADGRDYFFLSEADFEKRVADGDLIEYATVHGRYYGTLKQPILESLNQGLDVTLDLDVEGARQLRSHPDPELARALVDIFILPASLEQLAERIQARAPIEPEELALRLRNAEEEMRHWREYQYVIVTGEREADYASFRAIVEGERHRVSRLLT